MIPAQVCGLAIPLYSLGIVYFDTFAKLIGVAEIYHGTRLSGLSGPVIPPYGFGIVLSHTTAGGVVPAKGIHTTGVSGSGKAAVDSKRLIIPACVKSTLRNTDKPQSLAF